MIACTYAPLERTKEYEMAKYYHMDIYLLEEDELFQSRETMIEYLRDNWEEYCLPIGDEAKLVTIQDDDGKIILTYSSEDEDGIAVTRLATRLDYKRVQNTWLVSQLESLVTANLNS